MRILIAPQELKGTLTADQAAQAIAEGLGPGHERTVVALADGGPGTVSTIVRASAGASLRNAPVHDPLGRPIEAGFGVLPDRTAVVEMAAASGLSLIARPERDARVTTTFGTGELIRAALDAGCVRLLIGVGGSATNDGASGALSALGVRFLDRDGVPLRPGGAELERLSRIDASGLHPRLREVEITLATDVTNPLLGQTGATRIFGPQKGATPERVEQLERALAHYAQVVSATLGRDVSMEPGVGAAGGFAFGLRAFLGASIVSGFDLVARATRLEDKVRAAELVITAEGRFDSQSAHGKGPLRLAQLARAHGKRVVLFAGDIKSGTDTSVFDDAIAVSPEERPARPEIAFARLRDAVERWTRRSIGRN